MRLDEAAIKKLDLYARSSQLVTDSGFTDEELKEMKSSHALVGSSRVDLQACKLEYSIVSPK